MNAQALLFLLMLGTPYKKCLKNQQLDKMNAQALLFLLMLGTPYIKMFKEPATG